MSVTNIGEKIKTGVIFTKGGIFIKWFEWKERKIEIKKITHRWWTQEGQNKILHFSVIADGGCYEISYNLKSFDWVLEKVEVD